MKRFACYIVCFFVAAGIVFVLLLWPRADVAISQRTAVIVIDAGHGGFDSGAVGRLTKVKEDALNLLVAKKLQVFCENQGYTVIMTREDENAVGRTKDEDMQKRREIIEASNADVVISIHMNKFADTSCAGPVVFYHKESEEGERLAQTIQEQMVEALKPERPRTHKPETYFILRASTSPCVIVECGFVSNERDERLLQTEEYQDLCAQAIFKGVNIYLLQRFDAKPTKEISQ